MADERTWVSPFNYVQNNPISRVDPTGMLDGWIDYEENGQRNVEYRSDINTKAEAKAAGYKNVKKVIESGTLTASNGTVYNLSKTGGVSSDNVLGTINYNTTQDVITSGGSHIKGFLNGYDGPGAISSPSFSYFDRWDHQVAMGLWQGGSEAMIGGATRYLGKGIGSFFGSSTKSVEGALSLEEQAANLSQRINKNSFVIDDIGDGYRMQYDFKGATHKGIPTPHVQMYKLNINSATGAQHYNKVSKFVIPMTQKHINYLNNYMNSAGL